jgi:polar amino acid transport system permease protein
MKKLFISIPWWVITFSVLLVSTLGATIVHDNMASTLIYLAKGIPISLFVTITSYGLACLLALLLALMRASPHRIFRELATFYVEIMRGLPIIVILYYLSFALTPLFVNALNWLCTIPIQKGWLSTYHSRDISQTTRAIFALSLAYGAFMSEIIRSGIESLDHGQTEAGLALGLSHRQVMYHIILPQALRNNIPTMVNEFVALIKDSALVSVLGVSDITQLGKIYSANHFSFFETYSLVALIYLSLTFIFSFIAKWISNHYRPYT